jgi:hypothetical protein
MKVLLRSIWNDRAWAVLLVFCLLAGVSAAMAQGITVTGSVSDAETGDPLPGVNIVEKGTANGTTTDSEGRYTLSVAGPEARLVFSFIGYATQETVVGTQSVINSRHFGA